MHDASRHVSAPVPAPIASERFGRPTPPRAAGHTNNAGWYRGIGAFVAVKVADVATLYCPVSLP